MKTANEFLAGHIGTLMMQLAALQEQVSVLQDQLSAKNNSPTEPQKDAQNEGFIQLGPKDG
jgi:hypothetical protein